MSFKKILIAIMLLLIAGLVAVLTLPVFGKSLYHNAARMEAEAYGFHTEKVQAGDMEYTVYRGGTAQGRETLVLLHGYSADRQVWPRFARHFLDRYEVIIPDMAGHGDTGFRPGLEYSAPAQARRIVAMLDTLKIQRAHFAGNSMGGFITAHLGLGYPERVISLTLIDPAGLKSPQPSDMERQLAEGKGNPFEVKSREDFDAFYAMTMAQPPFLPPSVLAAMAEEYQTRRPELAEIFKQFHGRDMLDDRVGHITLPALVVWGDQDRLIHVSAAPIWAQSLVRGELHVFPGIGHMPMVEVPAETAAVVRTFIEKRHL